MRRALYSLIPLLFIWLGVGGTGESHKVDGIYRVHAGSRDGFEVWIVDGSAVRREIYPEFLYGGNPERYPFIPRGEIWIDNAIAAEEYEYTLAHELRERRLMTHAGMSYDDAHNAALALERKMRLADDSLARLHEASIQCVSPTDFDGVKEISSLPDSVWLHDIYRAYLGKRGEISVWVVDGAKVRREIYPDFGLSDNDLAAHFIPPKEIWIDGATSCEETEYSIATELRERELMAQGKTYDDAYEEAIHKIQEARRHSAISLTTRSVLVNPDSLEREIGTGDEK